MHTVVHHKQSKEIWGPHQTIIGIKYVYSEKAYEKKATYLLYNQTAKLDQHACQDCILGRPIAKIGNSGLLEIQSET
eukprot:scaffold53157_cov18-Prasinocladus_malaysianus.AAC.1